jgi:type II secretory pathway component GspD/PulD (secretin)
MKKIAHLILLTGMAGTLAVHAQTNATNPTPVAAVLAAMTNGTGTVSNAETVMPVTNSPEVSTPAPAVAVTNVTTTTSVIATNVVKVTVTNAAVEVAPVTPAAVAGIPLIQFSDVPLTTAIENLARQAGINYMLDPKIGYGQPDANGQVKAEPTLSIRWENITPENALLALLDNYNLQLTRDRDTGIARISMKDPAALPPLITRVVQLQYSSVSNMTDAVRSTLTDKRSKVIADSRTSQMVVVATDPEQQAVDTLVIQLDKPTKQVLIETKLVEISSNPTSSKGIDWTSTLQAQHIAYGNNLTTAQTTVAPGFPSTASTASTTSTGSGSTSTGSTTGTTSSTTIQGFAQQLGVPSLVANTASGFGSMGFLNADGLNVVLSFLNQSQDAQVISTPRVVTLDNEMAQISVTRGYPVFSVTAGTANTAGGSQVAYTNVGTVLQVTPRISANEQIWLKVDPQVASYAGLQSQTVGGLTYQAPLFDFRTFDTQVLVPNAHTLVMGGMVSDNPISTSTKVPLLGDIPYLGYAFRSENKTTTKDNLLIFITPTIVRNTDFHATETQFLNSKPTKRPVMLDPNSLWDGTRPYNWSNPTNTDPAQQIIDEPSVQ